MMKYDKRITSDAVRKRADLGTFEINFQANIDDYTVTNIHESFKQSA